MKYFARTEQGPSFRFARGRLGSAVALCALALLCTCSLKPPRVGERPPQVPKGEQEESYQKVLARYSQQRELYAHFDTRVLAGATLQSWPFRQARAERMASFQKQPQPVLEQHLAEERAQFDAVHEFFFAANVTDYHFDDFDRRTSVWRIALVTDRGEFTPSQVERIGRSNVNSRAYYPYFDDFWVGYAIRFSRTFDGAPIVPDAEATVTLRISSTLGQMDFVVPAQ